jgi:hypothetical protein
MDRVDTLIAELSCRYQNTNSKFLTAVRPIVVKILDAKTPEDARVPLLEMLAETFERDVTVRADCESARVAWAQFTELSMRLLKG